MAVFLVLHKVWLSSYLPMSNTFCGGGTGKEEGGDPGGSQYSIRNKEQLFIEARGSMALKLILRHKVSKTRCY